MRHPFLCHPEYMQASPHAANEYDGRTALHRACACGHADVVDILIEAGADAAVAMRDGSTSLHVAAASGQADVIERLLRASASDDSEAPGESCDTPVCLRRCVSDSGRICAWDGNARCVAGPTPTRSDSPTCVGAS
eukprot:scaffold181864_cov32-Tisochrysis_lutea.AAC.5